MSKSKEEKSSEIKEEKFIIVALPLIARTRLSLAEQDYVKNYVKENGYYIFDPVRITRMLLDLGYYTESSILTIPMIALSITEPEWCSKLYTKSCAKLCTLLYAAFKQLLLVEHEVGATINARVRKVINKRTIRYDEPGFATSGPNVLTEIMLRQYEPCIRELLKKDLKLGGNVERAWYQLINDLYTGRDAFHVFGSTISASPEEEKEATEPLPEESLEIKEGKEEKKEAKKETEGKESREVKEGNINASDIMDMLYRSVQKESEDYLRPSNKNNTAIILLDNNYKYLGHVYVYPSPIGPNTLSMIGIRSSVENVACHKMPKIANKIIKGVFHFAALNNFKYLSVTQPLEKMIEILKLINFHMIGGNAWITVPTEAKLTSNFSYIDFGCRYPFIQLTRAAAEREAIINAIINQKIIDSLIESSDIQNFDDFLKWWIIKHPYEWRWKFDPMEEVNPKIQEWTDFINDYNEWRNRSAELYKSYIQSLKDLESVS